jgi:hypothetical protein
LHEELAFVVPQDESGFEGSCSCPRNDAWNPPIMHPKTSMTLNLAGDIMELVEAATMPQSLTCRQAVPDG